MVPSRMATPILSPLLHELPVRISGTATASLDSLPIQNRICLLQGCNFLLAPSHALIPIHMDFQAIRPKELVVLVSSSQLLLSGAQIFLRLPELILDLVLV